MYFLLFAILLLAASLDIVQEDLQTAPFNLVISAANKSIDSKLLTSCHEGAAIEALCLTSPISGSASEYTLNYTYQDSHSQGFGTMGFLTWMLPINEVNFSSTMKFSYTPISNVVVPLITTLESSTEVGFDNQNKMFIQGYLDDTNPYVTLLPSRLVVPKPYYRWFVCETNAGYSYQTLAWVVGISLPPQNPSCQKVNVTRKFI